MTESDSLGEFVKREILPTDTREYLRDTAWSATFLLVGLAIGVRLAGEYALSRVCTLTGLFASPGCLEAAAGINRATTLLAIGAVGALLVSTYLTFLNP